MKKTILRFVCTFLAATLVFGGCAQEEPAQSSGPVVQINPLAEGVSNDETVARLYYGFGDNLLLAGENRRIRVPINESTETSVLNELIHEGPSATSTNLTQVINPDTTVVAAINEGQYLDITLSREFLEPVLAAGNDEAPSGAAERTRRYLAVYSIVNTMIEQGNYARVRIMIDEDGSGSGRPLTLPEAGMPGSGEAEPFSRNGDIELTALNTMRQLLSSVEQRDWSSVYEFIAYKNEYGQDKPTLEEFRNEAENARFSVSGTDVLDGVLAADGVSEIIMVSYELKPAGGETQSFVNVPSRLILENDVWKMTYDVFSQTFLN